MFCSRPLMMTEEYHLIAQDAKKESETHLIRFVIENTRFADGVSLLFIKAMKRRVFRVKEKPCLE